MNRRAAASPRLSLCCWLLRLHSDDRFVLNATITTSILLLLIFDKITITVDGSIFLSVAEAIVVIAQIACLAHSTRIEFTIRMLAQLCLLDTTLRVVAILAHATRVVMIVDVLAFRDLFAVLDLTLLLQDRVACSFFATLRFNGSRSRCNGQHSCLELIGPSFSTLKLVNLLKLSCILVPWLNLLYSSFDCPKLLFVHFILALSAIPCVVIDSCRLVFQLHRREALGAD